MSGYQDERVPFPSPGRLRRELGLRRPPWWMIAALAIVVVLTWVPLWIIYVVRTTDSPRPRVHLIQDMDVQPRYKTQAASDVFADGRAMRQPVADTVARGQLQADDHADRGYRMAHDADAIRVIYFDALPPALAEDDALTLRGAAMYAAHCAVCHGPDADGAGAMNQWARDNQLDNWVVAPSLLAAVMQEREAGYLYHVIRQGSASMPAFGSRIAQRDRWAIVAYLRELQSHRADDKE